MHLSCNIERVTYDGTPATLPQPWRAVLVWLPLGRLIGYRHGRHWHLAGCVYEIEAGEAWAYLAPVAAAAREAY